MTKPLAIGQHSGNYFTVTLRNLPKSVAGLLGSYKRKDFSFINYYDLQRFGLPANPLVSPYVGQSLLKKDYKNALKYCREGGLLNGIENDISDYKGYFSAIDNRKIILWYNSFYSLIWNATLSNMISRSKHHHTFCWERHTFNFFKRLKLNMELLSTHPMLDLPKFRVSQDNTIYRIGSSRATVIQSNVNCLSIGEDDVFSGAFTSTLSFCLPTGCYATMLIKQLLVGLLRGNRKDMLL